MSRVKCSETEYNEANVIRRVI